MCCRYSTPPGSNLVAPSSTLRVCLYSVQAWEFTPRCGVCASLRCVSLAPSCVSSLRFASLGWRFRVVAEWGGFELRLGLRVVVGRFSAGGGWRYVSPVVRAAARLLLRRAASGETTGCLSCGSQWLSLARSLVLRPALAFRIRSPPHTFGQGQDFLPGL